MVGVKVCGIRCVDTAKGLSAIPVDYLGLIFVSKSPRYVTLALAKELINAAPNKKWVGVFQNEALANILATANDLNLSAVQLHGDEDVTFIKTLKATLSGQVAIWKVVSVAKESDLKNITHFSEVADLVLLDTMTRGNDGKTQAGGTGKKFDWQILKILPPTQKFILAGGIGPKDVSAINHLSKSLPSLTAIDINSRFELSPGIKDTKLIAKFISELSTI